MTSRITLPIKEVKSVEGITLKELEPNVFCSVRWNDRDDDPIFILKLPSSTTGGGSVVICFNRDIKHSVYSENTSKLIKLYDIKPLDVVFKYQS
jgi:hypothetical protein